jgi:uncharacterized RDD family membrane protein YckC
VNDYVYAGFWWRFLAHLVDGAVLAVVIFIGTAASFGTLGIGAGILVPWLYFALFESSPRQATPGKMICGVIVTNLNGQRISFARATGRYFAKFLSALIFCIGFMMAGWTRRKQALHDMVADCLVLRQRVIESGPAVKLPDA